MSKYKRLSSVTYEQVTDAATSFRAVERTFERNCEDGVIEGHEIEELRQSFAEAGAELLQAVLIAKDTDVVESIYDFRRHVGRDQPVHQRIREQMSELLELEQAVARAVAARAAGGSGSGHHKGVRLHGKADKAGLRMRVEEGESNG